MNENKIFCACNGLECYGPCRTQHLERARDWSDPENFCPSAYGEGINRGKKISKKKSSKKR